MTIEYREESMRNPMIAGNWKMNTNVGEAINLIREIQTELETYTNVEIVLCPPFISLVPAYKLIQGSRTKLGAQNIYFEEKGAFTGEISAPMLAGICEYVIIGHSERRQYFQESNEMIRKKVAAAIRNNLKPILCVGENLQEYEAGKTKEVVAEQLVYSLEGIDDADTLTIAYEPIWAIGTGRAATGQQANETISLIRSFIARKYGGALAEIMRILYGGSVNFSNIEEFISQPDIDGALVGGASLKAKEFASIIKVTFAHKNKK
jgi:triosephosphate isomerase (TIM)